MNKDIFEFKHFKVRQADSAMKVGTDGVLLGAWVDVSHATSALDVGCGTGLIALMMAQRNPALSIEGVEIDPIAATEAFGNFEASPWSERLSIRTGDFLEMAFDRKYDLVVTNPPFFKTGQAAPEQRRAMARHSDTLPFEKLLRKSASLLNEGGRFVLIAPMEVKEDIEFFAGEANLWLRTRLHVHTLAHKPAKRLIWEYVNIPAEAADIHLCLQKSGGDRSDAYAEMTKDFYL